MTKQNTEKPVKERVVKSASFRAKRSSYNPFTKQHFPAGVLVEDVEIDSWLESQLAAGYIEQV